MAEIKGYETYSKDTLRNSKNIGLTERNTASQATRGSDNTVIQTTVEPSKGAVDKIEKSNTQVNELMADYYRYGEYTVETDKKTKKKVVKYKSRPLTLNQGKLNKEATIRVVRTTGSGKNQKDEDLLKQPYTKFILESVQETRQERSQIIETFGDFYVFFFGERPPIFTYTGSLINAVNTNWVMEFNYYYEKYLKGTSCANSNSRIILRYGNFEIEGFILNASMSMTADVEARVPFTFTCVVTKRKDLVTPDDFDKSVSQETRQYAIRQMLKTIAGKEGRGTSESGVSDAFSKAKSVMTSDLAPKASSIA